MRPDGRAPRFIRPRPRPRIIAAAIAERARQQRAGRHAVSPQLARADGLHAGAGVARRRNRCLCAPFSSAVAARQRPDPGGDASPLYVSAYAELVENVRRQLPDASIGTDVIIGFPGETDADFEELANYLESAPITHVHVFPYSDRPGTVASTLPRKVAGTAIRERARRIREISTRLNARFLDGQIGQVHRGLSLDDGTLVVTGNYLKVRIPPGHARNEWLRVRVTDREPVLTGEVV